MDSTQLAHEDMVTRFEAEMKWKDDLENKSVSILGFVGIFIAVLVSIPTLGDDGELLSLKPIILSLGLQIAAACLLFAIAFGYAVSIGPKVDKVCGSIRNPAEYTLPKLVGSYAISIAMNRILFSKRFSWYQVSIWLIVTSLIQLVIGLIVNELYLAEKWLQDVAEACYWLPGILLAAAGIYRLDRDYRKMKDQHERTYLMVLKAMTRDGDEANGGQETGEKT